MKKMKVEIYNTIKQTSAGFHSWVNSSVGIIRKPNDKIGIEKEEIIKKEKIKWYLRFWLWIKKVFHLTRVF